MPKDSKLIIEKAREQLINLADLARQIEETLSSADAEEEKLERLAEDRKGIESIKNKLKSFFGV